MEHPLKDAGKVTVRMLIWLCVAVCFLIVAGSCVQETEAPVAGGNDPGVLVKPVGQAEQLTIFLTGNELGALKPCGCSGGQLGGLDRRPPVFSRVPRERRLIIDTGSLVPSDSLQDIYKFSILHRAFDLLDYDVVNLSAEDLRMARNQGLLANPQTDLVSSYVESDEQVGRAFTKRYTLRGRPLDIVIVPFDPESMPIADVAELLESETNGLILKIVILNNGGAETVELVKQSIPSLDCLVCPAESDEPLRVSEPGNRPLVFSMGRYGKYVCELQVTSPADGGTNPQLSFRKLAVTEDLDPNDLLEQLYKQYQRMVRDSNLLESHPRYPLSDGLRYVGSEACRICHEEESDKWDTTRHADAYATLEREDVGSEADPECVGCHVIGFDYEGGFVTKEKTPKLKDVGCENCHGPASKHVSSGGAAELGEERSTCEDCHTPEHSGEYGARKDEYLEKIIHW